MFYLFWPGKPIPTWLEEIKFKQAQRRSNPYIAHGGFGVVALRNNQYHVAVAYGAYITVRNCNDIEIIGGKSGVLMHRSVVSWLRAVCGNYEPR